MRICYFHDEKYPNTETDTQQVAKNLEGLALAGADVTLFVPRFPGNWFTGERFAGAIMSYYGVRKPYPVRGVWCPIPYSPLRAEKLYHGVAAPLVAAAAGCDLVYSRNSQAVLAGLALGKSALFETYKPLPEVLPGLFRVLKAALASPRFLGIVTHSEYARSSFTAHGVSREKVVTLYNGLDPADMLPVLSRAEARASLGLPEAGRLVGYAGNMHPAKDLPALIRVMGRVPEARLLLVGGSESHRQEVARFADTEAPGKVILAGWVPGYRLAPYLYACDVLAIAPSARALYQTGTQVLPMKLFQYLAAARPIYLPDLPDTRELIVHGVHGIRTPPGDLARNVADLEGLLADAAAQERMGENCARLARDLTWENRGRKLLSFIAGRQSMRFEERGPLT
jgi:glycosyltransferase involved in cell wall biosynthesis